MVFNQGKLFGVLQKILRDASYFTRFKIFNRPTLNANHMMVVMPSKFVVKRIFAKIDTLDDVFFFERQKRAIHGRFINSRYFNLLVNMLRIDRKVIFCEDFQNSHPRGRCLKP